ncbi:MULTISPECIES: undecaprenyldiphospho-muramoylpentapeptide beta-N-acetylglucosaminyltransferase [Brucella]|uniref:UDP-N-acetylglucosamine--N-acetylmuramyl-(pentapeptide) pyrophosphoryl-undecaprenol N-acetylglucosamine transferase n=1 Tax=Ochrobactrum soli TaxID=2448455 RepID=A0A2P9HNZ5_9HYPH|nr:MULTISPECIES: undecaprenyldiphospho-muramoylpentapeptide beta-N-acetylglucosaminyltransferase [Brucella]MDX4075955.1 undecaprenyldiphospho-muramoylpentapeptide beta-N-acetylglucosaminyltransferase [Brucella sp. NBRC 113783]RRD24907.1 undecaprenyldiphospho-muramoylpentapeptide beta-N-acetylglucosaminyltransferase [Brucellaceae bacterium VT-16-1752]SPL65855.1 UDP-N-acetylglucosamine--N-acetylmuramyl-(pentapeptide) pyrophosphoryl-undecaprenol N-acetylglucosamine transferase [[Ochrobactrum] soli]
MAKGVIVLAAGGTGGHLFPAEALAHELKSRGWDVHLATDARAQRFAGAFDESHVHVIRSATIAGRNPIALLKTFWSLWQGNLDSRKLFRRLKPQLVAGFGGYPTLPPLYAASNMHIPTLVHEQNAVMGRANKGLAGRVKAIAGGFLPETGGAFADKTVTTGNPVRPPVLAAAATPYKQAKPDERFRLLVFGGSQGAQFFSNAIPAAVALLPEKERARLLITQQARKEDEASVREAYKKLGIPADVAPFFNDMPARMADAHFVISRSGASTVSEITVIGRPAILVPFPHALDHDQAANAAALANAGGGEVVRQADLSPERLAQILQAAMNEPERLENQAKAAKSVGKPDAARLLADLAEAIATGKSVHEFKEGTRP